MASTTCSLMQSSAVRTPFRSNVSLQHSLLPSLPSRRTHMRTAAKAEGKVTREYNEEDGSVKDGKNKPLYADELPVCGVICTLLQ